MHDLQAYTVCGAEGEFNIFVTNGHPEDIVVSAASNNFELIYPTDKWSSC